MLARTLKKLLGSPRPPADAREEFPIDELRALKDLHERAPLDLHKRILFEDETIEGTPLLALFQKCVSESDTGISPWKAFARIHGIVNLTRYFLYSLELGGLRAECGVFRGLSALFVCHAAALRLKTFSGADFHLVDSFEGFPTPKSEDFIPINAADKPTHGPAFKAGDAASSFHSVKSVFKTFPDVRLHKGFIPDVFSQLPDANWAFVHIDVDLYQPTLDSLDYFYPRMVKGGCIICDDYGSKLFPGARKAWELYCNENNVPFIVLETGQSVIIH